MSGAAREISLALLSSSGMQLAASALRKELRRRGWSAKIWEAGFNQHRQEIANPESRLYTDQPDAAILHLDGEDVFAELLRDPFAADRGARRERALRAAEELEGWVASIHRLLPQTLIVVNTVWLPPAHALTGLEYNSPWGLSDLAAQYNDALASVAAARSGVLVHDVASLAHDLGYRQWFDPRLWHLARCRMSDAAMKSYARSLAALLRAWKGETRKCLVLDLDNTLWGGVVGEEGVDGIVLGEEGPGLAFAEFQEELARLSRKGVLLAICSKNNEADALEALRRHPSMRLREDSFAARRINWQDKAANLRELAAELNLGLDSFVFIDDNPAERALVRQALPEVHVPEWPQEPSDYRAALLDLSQEQFCRFALTSEDSERTAMYRAERQRAELAASTATLPDYYRSLEMRAQIGLADSLSIPRIAQLTQKTNQFNLTTRRYTDAEIRAFAERNDALALWLRLEDRFSNQGLVGVMILKRAEPAAWNIDTLLLSCRVIGRGVETAFLAFACDLLRRRGAEAVSAEYIPTSKNGLAANVYRDLGFDPAGDDGAGATRWRLDLREKAIPSPDWIRVEAVQESAHVG